MVTPEASGSNQAKLDAVEPDEQGQSQLVAGPKVKEVASRFDIGEPSDLLSIRDTLNKYLETLPYNEETKEAERKIRWRRTAEQILIDRYVYQSKSCTDRVIVFLAICKELGINGQFVKVKNNKYIHSLAEVKIGDDWYIFDVSNKSSVPVKGQVTEEVPFDGWRLWGKGRDAWDLGLVDYDSIENI